jgi:hypothetical protein
MTLTVDEFQVADPADAWARAGFGIDATASFFGARTTPVKDAVQAGRRITTIRHQDFGMSVRTAMISAPILGK